jgi:heme-degrading monooxygenase HmoA
MIWFFERGQEVVRVETRVDNSTREYVLVIWWADRAAETERFQTREAFDTRIKQLEERLMTENYAQARRPTILAEGWRGPVSH